jgi:hypothetical protein
MVNQIVSEKESGKTEIYTDRQTDITGRARAL